jgi:cobalt-zinc-cadmium efflux system outer membrane protein
MVASLGDSIISQGMGAAVFAEFAEPPSLDSLMARSGAVRLAEIELSSARASRQLLRAERRPAIGASIGVQRFATEDGGFSVGPAAGISVSLPFTVRRSNLASALTADRDVETAEAWQRAILASVRSELASAIDRYEAARARVSLFEAALLRGAREERESALASYRTGELSLVELLDFERALSRAEISRLQSYMEAAHALADLMANATDAEGRFEQADLRLDGGR